MNGPVDIFDVVGDIMSTKGGSLADDHDLQATVRSSFMLQRWVSMACKPEDFAILDITNRVRCGGSDVGDAYRLLVGTLPPRRRQRLRYLKGWREDDDPSVREVAAKFEISTREALERIRMVEMLGKEHDEQDQQR